MISRKGFNCNKLKMLAFTVLVLLVITGKLKHKVWLEFYQFYHWFYGTEQLRSTIIF